MQPQYQELQYNASQTIAQNTQPVQVVFDPVFSILAWTLIISIDLYIVCYGSYKFYCAVKESKA